MTFSGDDMTRGADPDSAEEERLEFLSHLNALIDKPLTVLSVGWLALVIAELVAGLSPELQALTLVLWALFVLDYLLELAIAPDRVAYLRSHWLGGIALVLPALRVLAVFRAFRIFRSLRLLRTLSLARVLTATNRGLRATRVFLGRRRFGFVLASYVLVMLTGAAAIYFFESGSDQASGIQDVGDALWWSAMMMTTMGSQFWPETWEGRLVAWLLALYAFLVFGYITATLASFFIESDTRPSP